MADQSAAPPPSHASQAGHQLATSDWLDLHFAACRPEYEAGLRAVGIAPGWRVLDAGCGGGSYLPWLAELCGAGGSVAALDLEAGNVAAVRDRLAAWQLPCPVEVRQGDVLALPYPDASFDAVWCANISQYFPDDALARMLGEFRRVTRPGGLVAVKEFDLRPVRLTPAPPALFWHYAEGGASLDAMTPGTLRAAELGMWLRRAGLVDTRQRTILIERFAPLGPTDRRYLAEVLAWFAGRRAAHEAAGAPGVPAEERAVWHNLAGGDRPGTLLDHPDFGWCEGSAVVVGRVPGANGA